MVFPDPSTTNSRRRAFARNVDFSFIVSGSERTFTFRVSLNTLPTLATLVQDIVIHTCNSAWVLYHAIVGSAVHHDHCSNIQEIEHGLKLIKTIVIVFLYFTICHHAVTLGGSQLQLIRNSFFVDWANFDIVMVMAFSVSLYYSTHPVNFSCERKPEYPENAHGTRQSVDLYSFHMNTGFESY